MYSHVLYDRFFTGKNEDKKLIAMLLTTRDTPPRYTGGSEAGEFICYGSNPREFGDTPAIFSPLFVSKYLTDAAGTVTEMYPWAKMLKAKAKRSKPRDLTIAMNGKFGSFNPADQYFMDTNKKGGKKSGFNFAIVNPHEQVAGEGETRPVAALGSMWGLCMQLP